MGYRPPLSEYNFLLEHVIGFQKVRDTARFADATSDVSTAILSEAGKMSQDILAPLNRQGDLHPAALENGVVKTSPDFGKGYAAIADGGWVGMSADPEYGGMGLPLSLTNVVNEMMGSACLSLQLNPLMTQGQIEALETHASDEIKALYLPKLISGAWSGTMNLTEPQAGSDVGALSTKAVSNDDGTYAIHGQKIFISWGDNDFTENVCHLVLARLPDAGTGTKGISLFMVPRNIPDANGVPGVRNKLKVVSLEEKMGLHGSPTAVMQYDGATGWLIGERHAGMKAMFTMMNNARLGVATQGICVAEAAYQHALSYAQDRKQGKAGGTGSIIEHADVRRMLATMKAEVFAARAIAFACAAANDMAEATKDAKWRARGALLTPIAKAFGTDIGCEVSAMGVQVHGGMGYIEETGAAQFTRDVRVTAIYEGTNGIQAMDLVARKMMDNGDAIFDVLDEITKFAKTVQKDTPEMADAVIAAVAKLADTSKWMLAQGDLNDRFAGAVPYLRAFARVLGGYYHLRAANADGADGSYKRLASFYIARLMPEYAALLAHAEEGYKGLYEISNADLMRE